jgi:hypothetical protein
LCAPTKTHFFDVRPFREKFHRSAVAKFPQSKQCESA